MNKLFLILVLATIIFNTSCKNNPASSKDTEKPIVSILYPANNSEFDEGTIITINIDASDNEGIKEVNILIDGELEFSDESEPYRYDWNTSGKVGYHTLKAKASDESNNIGESNIINFKINAVQSNTAPIASFTINPTSGEVGTIFTFNASGCSDNEDATSMLRVRWDWENDGIWDTNYSTSKIATHLYDLGATYTVNCEVEDSGGLTNTIKKTVNVQQPNPVVNFPDPNFEALIREVLNIDSGNITESDLLSIESLEGDNRNISNIDGIEFCYNIKSIKLKNNQISDISGLADLTNINVLHLSENQISNISALEKLSNLENLGLFDNYIYKLIDFSELTNLVLLELGRNQIGNISDLSGLTNLRTLGLFDNQISDINVLSDLLNLKYLSLGRNQISDISGLADLTNLTELGLGENQISNISALEELSNLDVLWLEYNQIINIYPLFQNQGISNGDTIFLTGNPLNETSINTYIPGLEARGVTVYY